MPQTVPNPRAHESLPSSLVSPAGFRPLASVSPAAPPAYWAALRLWHLASFDAPSVALVWSLGFAWAARVRLPAWVLLLQVLVVWVVYVGDRLLDARAGMGQRNPDDLRERHFFHWRHRTILAPLAIAGAVVAAWISLRWMPANVKARDAVLGLVSLAYFARVHAGRAGQRVSRLFSKELLVGALFTCGCALPAWSRTGLLRLAMPGLFFAVVAWLNCRAIDRWESDPRPGQTFRLASTVALAGLGACAALLWTGQPRIATLLAAGAASAWLLGMLDRAATRLTPVALRALADLVLLAPALLLFWGRLP